MTYDRVFQTQKNFASQLMLKNMLFFRNYGNIFSGCDSRADLDALGKMKLWNRLSDENRLLFFSKLHGGLSSCVEINEVKVDRVSLNT